MTVKLDTHRPVAPAPPVGPGALAWLRRSLHGEVTGPGHPSYDEQRRVWNGSIDRHPAAILRCADVADVRLAVAVARRAALPLAVRGGGRAACPGCRSATTGSSSTWRR